MKKTDYSAFTLAVAEAGPQPEITCKALEKITQELVGAKLFTLMIANTETRESERVYTNMPDAYPASGTKPFNDTFWTDITLVRKHIFVANSIEDIAQVFYDYELINSLGCQSVINIPVTVRGQVIGTINCLHEAGYYTEERIKAAEALKLPGAVCMMMFEKPRGNKHE